MPSCRSFRTRFLPFLSLALAVTALAPARAELSGVRSAKLQDGFAGALDNGFAFDDDSLGQALAVGDFNGDGYDDLAIGENESLTAEREGAVHVVYSNAQGLGASDQIFKDYDPSTLTADRELYDDFGSALAAGDWNGDGYDDLAIGVPGEHVGTSDHAGMVLIQYGHAGGLSQTGLPQTWRWSLTSVTGVAVSAEDRFGDALAAGDFNGDGRDDLAIGIPGADVGGAAFAGRVLVMLGDPTFGISEDGARLFDQNSSGADGTMLDSCEVSDRFGAALAAGDFDGDGFDDLAIGVPGEGLASATEAGAVQVLYGAATVGLRLTGNQFWNESNVDTGGDVATFDYFGAALAAGDVTGEGTDDLVIGAPLEDVDGFQDAGAVTLLWGLFGAGLTTTGSQIYDQSDLGDGETPEPFDNFGYSLAIGDFLEGNGPGLADLAIGIVQESVPLPGGGGQWIGAGAVTVVRGGFGLEPAHAVLWAQGYRGSVGAADLNVGQAFGEAIAAGDFDGDGSSDLAVGAPSVNGQFTQNETGVNSGAVYVLLGSLFSDGFETEDTSLWSSSN